MCVGIATRVGGVLVGLVTLAGLAACGDGHPTFADAGPDGAPSDAAPPDATDDAATDDAATDDAATDDAATDDAATDDAATDDAATDDAAATDATTDAAEPIVTGVTIIPPPASVVPNVTESNTAILMFAEQAGLTLAAPAPVDLHVPAMYAVAPGALATIPAGTTVDVHFVHFDPVGASATVDRLATIEMPREILGVIVATSTLEATDTTLGLAGVAYPATGTHPARELELASEDVISLGADRRTITLDLRTSTSADQLRIVTLAAGAAPRITSTTAAVGAPPASVVTGATESNAAFTVFVERAGALGADVAVDAVAPGTYTANAQLGGGTIAAGTDATCYLVHLDSVGGATVIRRGTITFQGPILGVALRTATLDASDATCGHAGTTYPVGDATREVELTASESLLWAPDGRSLRFDLGVTTGADQLRVLVAE